MATITTETVPEERDGQGRAQRGEPAPLMRIWLKTAGRVVSPGITGQHTAAVPIAALHLIGVIILIWREAVGTIARPRITGQRTMPTTIETLATPTGHTRLHQDLTLGTVHTGSLYRGPHTNRVRTHILPEGRGLITPHTAPIEVSLWAMGGVSATVAAQVISTVAVEGT